MFASHQRKLILVRTDPIQDLVQEPSDFKTSIEAASSNEIVLIEDRRAKDSFQNLSNFSKFMEDYDWNDSRLLVSTPINDVLLRETCWLYMYHNSKDYANDPSIIHLRRLVMSITDNKHEFNSAIFHAPQEQNTIDSYSNTLGSLIFFHINVNVEELHDAILQKVQDLNDALARLGLGLSISIKGWSEPHLGVRKGPNQAPRSESHSGGPWVIDFPRI